MDEINGPTGEDTEEALRPPWCSPKGDLETLTWQLDGFRHLVKEIFNVLTPEQRIKVYEASTGRDWEE